MPIVKMLQISEAFFVWITNINKICVFMKSKSRLTKLSENDILKLI